METPRISPVGIVEYPDDYEASPRGFSRPIRVFASLLLGFFFAATVITGALSVGAYCLTSDGGDTRALQAGIERLNGSAPDAPPPTAAD